MIGLVNPKSHVGTGFQLNRQPAIVRYMRACESHAYIIFLRGAPRILFTIPKWEFVRAPLRYSHIIDPDYGDPQKDPQFSATRICRGSLGAPYFFEKPQYIGGLRHQADIGVI